MKKIKVLPIILCFMLILSYVPIVSAAGDPILLFPVKNLTNDYGNTYMFHFGTCGLGCRCSLHNGNHEGSDISTGTFTVGGKQDTPYVIASHSGKVTMANLNGGYGNQVSITATTNGDTVQTDYCHLKEYYVGVGQNVKAGQVIGKVGTTGRSTGNHLHFNVKVNGNLRNPADLIKDRIISDSATRVSSALTRAFYAGATYMGHEFGYHPGNENYWAANVLNPSGYMLYGPYTTSLPVGMLTAKFRMAIDNNNYDNLQVCTIDVCKDQGRTVLASRRISRTDFLARNTFQDFDLNFYNTTGAQLEFRVYFNGISQLSVETVKIYKNSY